MLSDKALKNVQAFLSSCDELISGRFIFAENIIAKVLQNITESEEIYDLISECMKNFNYDKELNKARIKLPSKNGYFVMPENKAIILPLVFCLLVDIRDKKISFREFLKNYFTTDEEGEEFKNFALTVIEPFKQAVVYCFEAVNRQEEEKEQAPEVKPEVESLPENKEPEQKDEKFEEFVADIKRACAEIVAQMEREKYIKQSAKDDSLYLINCLKIACDEKDTNTINMLIVSLQYVLKEIKPVRFLGQELRQILYAYYS